MELGGTRTENARQVSGTDRPVQTPVPDQRPTNNMAHHVGNKFIQKRKADRAASLTLRDGNCNVQAIIFMLDIPRLQDYQRHFEMPQYCVFECSQISFDMNYIPNGHTKPVKYKYKPVLCPQGYK